MEVSPELAEERGLSHMGWAHVVTARTAIEARVLVTERMRPMKIGKRTLHTVWLPYHWGSNGYTTGDSANDLFGITLDPNVLIQESKAGTCDVQPGRRPTGPALLEYVERYRERAGVADEHFRPIVTANLAKAKKKKKRKHGDSPKDRTKNTSQHQRHGDEGTDTADE
jgi:formate dehydrogenase major subunit